MRFAMGEGSLPSVQTSRGGPMISHLLFADDCILFGEASLWVVRVLKDILLEYEVNLGQCINFVKSSIFLNFLGLSSGYRSTY